MDRRAAGHRVSAVNAEQGPTPTPLPPSLPAPRDVAYPGVLKLAIDATDTARGIIVARQSIPIAEPGRITLVYPKWIPGYHSPQNPIELFAGLQVKAGGESVSWRRDPIEVHAFHVEPPEDCKTLDVDFQFLSPTNSSQGDVVVTGDLMNLQWGRMVLYPAGYYARRIEVELTLTLPQGWAYATVLQPLETKDQTIRFEPVRLDILVDSPLMAGPHMRQIPLDEDADVAMALFAHQPDHLAAHDDKIAVHKALVEQAVRLFGSRHFDRYRFLVALSDELGGGGVEHHRSTEIIAPPTHFTEWERNLSKRDVFGHEFTHSWNGKFRRGADSWVASFEQPIRNSLMWVYEGQTQYWGQVLTARSGLWSKHMALGALAKVAATYDVRPGGKWRTLSDTTRDPIVVGREPLPWPSWQRNEDYYSEGQLMWLAIDTLIRERTGDARSLDDFAKAFFGVEDGRMETLTYDYDEVVRTLNDIAPYDWSAKIDDMLESRQPGAPLEGLERGGYRLVYREYRNDFCKTFDTQAGQYDIRFSVGLTLTDEGSIQEVMWDSAAFHAGLTAGAQIKAVDGVDYHEQVLNDAIDRARDGKPIRLSVITRGRSRDVDVGYAEGHRFPHLEPIEGARLRLDEILAAR